MSERARFFCEPPDELGFVSREYYLQRASELFPIDSCRSSFSLLVGVRGDADGRRTAPIRRVSREGAYPEVEEMGKLSSVAARRSGLGGRGWQEWREEGVAVPQR